MNVLNKAELEFHLIHLVQFGGKEGLSYFRNIKIFKYLFSSPQTFPNFTLQTLPWLQWF